MATQPGLSIVCPILIGRAQHVQLLDQLIEHAREGAGHTVLLAGEAGIGKSRLIGEAKVRAAANGMQVMQGNCFEHDTALPFAPFVDLLQACALTQPPETLVHDIGPDGPEFVKLVPGVRALLSNCPAGPVREPEQEKRQLFHAFAGYFLRAAQRVPLLIVIEDVHWADDLSLELLLHLARRIEQQPAALVVSYRSEEASAQLEQLLATLDRLRLATEVALDPLLSPDVAAMLRGIFQARRPVTPGFLHVLYALTEGNPFFVEEVLKSALVEGRLAVGDALWDHLPLAGMQVPRGVQDVIRRRIAGIGPISRAVLNLAAVTGQRFDFAVLQSLTGLAEADLLTIIKELIDAQLIVEESAERFRFRHALTRQAIYASLLARERRALHREVADTLAARPGLGQVTPISELAYHYFEAGVWEAAFDYARQAAENAAALYAPREAITQYTRAIVAAEHLRGDGTAPPDAAFALRVALLTGRGAAHETLGNFQQALADYERALHIAEDHTEPPTTWQMLIQLGMLWTGRDYAQSLAHFERALALARTLDDPVLLAHSLNRIGNWRLNAAQPLAATRLHREALAIFLQLGDQRGLAATYDLLGMASYHSNNLAASADFYEPAVALWRRLDDRQGLVSSLSLLTARGGNLDIDSMDAGLVEIESGLCAGEEALQIAHAIGWRPGEAFAHYMLGMTHGLRGDYARAFALARSCLEIADEIGHRQWMTAGNKLLGHLYVQLLAPDEGMPFLGRALELARDPLAVLDPECHSDARFSLRAAARA